MIRSTLPTKARLRYFYEFSAVFNKGKTLSKGDFFVVNELVRNDLSIKGGESWPRLGLIIAKRYAKKSVTRNALKRVIRESFRIQRNIMPKNDYVVRLYKKILPQSLKLLRRTVRLEIDFHFQQAISSNENNSSIYN
ncbi:MAG: ribonuclease P protein component [Bordetella sp.]|nr:MAG: ribonuclease P protein component [Bordetella sp.]